MRSARSRSRWGIARVFRHREELSSGAAGSCALRHGRFFENRFEGAVPDYIATFTNLAILSVRDNDFESMPDLSVLLNVTTIRAEGNKFTFEDILPNIGVAADTYTYSPQQEVGDDKFIQVQQGSDYTIYLRIDENISGSTYEWFFDGSFET